MAEVKNAFIKSKMNKDLDDRLIPSGEYRDALNVQVSKSESSDTGALENILGNSVSVDFGLKVSVSNLECIGFFVDTFNNNIYFFATNYTDPSNNSIAYSASAENFIFKHNISTLATTVLVRGAFLNFSTTSPIIGVNLLEELLFFTDNRNQPRKINVNLANLDSGNITPSYYFNEDQISVATYNPYECIRVVKASEQAGAALVPTTLTAASNSKVLEVASTTYTSPNFPFNTFAIEVGNGIIGSGVKTGTVVVAISGNNITVNKTQNLASGASVVFVGLETSMYNVSSPYLYDDPGDDATINPYYDSSFSGDANFLKDKFVRFSYRFQFVDGENSIYAPFTQPCFIPEQDGYFLYTFNLETDESQTFQSTIVSFMENKVTQIKLQIPLPAYASELVSENSPFKIKAIDILYKESDALAVQVVDTVLVDAAFGVAVGQNDIFEYSYNSTKPFKTLPTAGLIRVYDKIPVRAFSQEIISNRVVYGNFQDKHTPPAGIDYQVNVSDKFSKNSSNSSKSIVEYPNSSLKQNRNYQVGIVLSDKFGRQSSTILSNNMSSLTDSGFGAATVFSDYQTVSDTSPGFWPGDSLKILFNVAISSERNLSTGTPGLYNGDPTSPNYNPLGWYSYKVVVQQKEQDYYNVYNAGAMKGSPTNVAQNISTSYISLVNDNINKVPRDLSEVGPTQKQFRSSVRLFGRVENTVYITSPRLDPAGNRQFYPEKLVNTTSSIEGLSTMFDLNGYLTDPANQGKPLSSSQNPFYPFYKSESDPLIAQITTSNNNGFGLPNTPGGSGTYQPIENLAIFETEPDLSRLDIYWETSTSGLISDLNIAINEENPPASDFTTFDTSGFNEGVTFGDNILVNNFKLVDFFGQPVPDADIDIFLLNKVFTTELVPQNVTSYFQLYEPNGTGTKEYNIKVTANFLTNNYYGSNVGKRDWDFKFTAVVNGVQSEIFKDAALKNVDPIIYVTPYTPAVDFTVTKDQSDTLITTLKATNGASVVDGDNPNTGKELVWSIVSVNGATGQQNFFTFNSSTNGVLSTFNLTNNQVGSLSSGTYTVVIKVIDAGGFEDEITVTVVINGTPPPPQICVSDFGASMTPCFGGGQDDHMEGFIYLSDTVTTDTDFTIRVLYISGSPTANCSGPLSKDSIDLVVTVLAGDNQGLLTCPQAPFINSGGATICSSELITSTYPQCEVTYVSAIKMTTTLSATCSSDSSAPSANYAYVLFNATWFTLDGGKNKVNSSMALMDTLLYNPSNNPNVTIHPDSVYSGLATILPGGQTGTLTVTNDSKIGTNKVLFTSDGDFGSTNVCP